MPEVLRFGPTKDTNEIYTDGAIMPHRFQELERQMPDGSWLTIGYCEIHAHKVKKDESDIEDVSIGTTVRINPKK